MNKQKVIFIGPAGGGKVPQNGASAKNYHLMNYFHKKKSMWFRLILRIGGKILWFLLN